MAAPTNTNNPNNNYTVSISTDTTGGDNTPNVSGYENSYILEIVPKPGKVIIAGNFKINGTISEATIHASLHGIPTNFSHPLAPGSSGITPISPTTDSKMVYTFPFDNYNTAPFNTPSFIFSSAVLTEVYLDDNGDEWYYGLNGSQQSIVSISNTDPIKLRLEVFLKSTFNSTVPTSNLTVELDIDEYTLTPIYGCTDPNAYNYNPNATHDDGSCVPIISGCTDPAAVNYYAGANTDDGSCIYPVYGCTDNTNMNNDGELAAINYDSTATHDDGSCSYMCYSGGYLSTPVINSYLLNNSQESGLKALFMSNIMAPENPFIAYQITKPDGSLMSQVNLGSGLQLPFDITVISNSDFLSGNFPNGTYTMTTTYSFPNSSPTIPDCVFIDTIDIVVGCGNSISENYDPNVNILDPNACITPIDTPSIE
tara:strand:+ start:7681 stop:8955 length:1275 start_codon:yes stop_codon:yes gene_type:complete